MLILEVLTASHLVTLEKCPGVQQIGVGETYHKIIDKATRAVIKYDILEAAGTLQAMRLVVKLPSMQCVVSSKMSNLRLYFLLMLPMHSTA